jgi:hypothetical protein
VTKRKMMMKRKMLVIRKRVMEMLKMKKIKKLLMTKIKPKKTSIEKSRTLNKNKNIGIQIVKL